MDLIWLIPLLPGLGAAINGLIGIRYFGKQAAAFVACATMAVAGAASDLTELRRRQGPVDLAVEFARSGKGDVIYVQIEAHADRIRGHQEIDVAGLVQCHLSIARARTQGPEHYRGAAAVLMDLIGRECTRLNRFVTDLLSYSRERDLVPALFSLATGEGIEALLR